MQYSIQMSKAFAERNGWFRRFQQPPAGRPNPIVDLPRVTAAGNGFVVLKGTHVTDGTFELWLPASEVESVYGTEDSGKDKSRIGFPRPDADQG